MTKKKSLLESAKEMPTDTTLEEGDQWFAIATSWWEKFRACQPAETATSVRNEPLIDKQFSSKSRRVAILKLKLEEGTDFVFVPEAAWEVISRELGFDWEIRREVIYQRSHQMLQIEPYPFAFQIYHWNDEADDAVELVDDSNRLVVVLGSRVHTLDQLLGEVWLAAPDDFRRRFPQFLGGISSDAKADSSESTPMRVSYRTVRALDGEPLWTPVAKLVKRSRTKRPSLKLKPRKRHTVDKKTVDDESDEDSDSEAEFDEHADQLNDPNGLGECGNVKLGDLRLDDRSETESGKARLHELLVEQSSTTRASVSPHSLGRPSQDREFRWRFGLAKDDDLDALDTTNRWFEARVLNARRNKVYVHYRGWDSKWDEWIDRTSSRIAPPHAHVAPWRGHLQPGSPVQVGLQVPGLRHTKWRNAKVLQVVKSTNKRHAQEGKEDDEDDEEEDEDGDGSARLRVHIQVDDNDLWMPARDDLLCQPNTHNVSKALSSRERRLLANDETLATETSDVVDTPKGAEESGSESDAFEVVEVEYDEDGSDVELLEHEGGTSPPARPPTTTAEMENAIEAQEDEVLTQETEEGGPTLNLNAMFDRIRGANRREPENREEQVVNHDHEASDCATNAQAEFRALWSQVGEELHASFTRLGEGIVALIEARQGSANRLSQERQE